MRLRVHDDPVAARFSLRDRQRHREVLSLWCPIVVLFRQCLPLVGMTLVLLVLGFMFAPPLMTFNALRCLDYMFLQLLMPIGRIQLLQVLRSAPHPCRSVAG